MKMMNHIHLSYIMVNPHRHHHHRCHILFQNLFKKSEVYLIFSPDRHPIVAVVIIHDGTVIIRAVLHRYILEST